MTNSLTSKVKRFTTNQSNAGASGTALIVNVLNHGIEHADWTPLGWMISGLHGTDRARVKRIAGMCLVGLTMKTDTKQPCGYAFKIDKAKIALTDTMASLTACADEKVSFRSKVLMEALTGEIAEANEAYDFEAAKVKLAKYLTTFVADMQEAGVTMDANAFMSICRQQVQEKFADFEPAH